MAINSIPGLWNTFTGYLEIWKRGFLLQKSLECGKPPQPLHNYAGKPGESRPLNCSRFQRESLSPPRVRKVERSGNLLPEESAGTGNALGWTAARPRNNAPPCQPAHLPAAQVWLLNTLPDQGDGASPRTWLFSGGKARGEPGMMYGASRRKSSGMTGAKLH